jgi:hypothetical protein
VNVPVSALRILVVGAPLNSTDAILARLTQNGWGSYGVDSLAEAKDVLRTIQFDVVLAAEHVPDGLGYDLTEEMISRKRSLLVRVNLSESCIWLPVVADGVRVLGKRAVNQQMLELELETLLLRSAKKRTGEAGAALQPHSKREIPPRRHVAASALAEAAAVPDASPSSQDSAARGRAAK